MFWDWGCLSNFHIHLIECIKAGCGYEQLCTEPKELGYLYLQPWKHFIVKIIILKYWSLLKKTTKTLNSLKNDANYKHLENQTYGFLGQLST